MTRRWRTLAAALAGLGGIAGIGWVYYHYEAVHADRYLEAALRALDQGDRHEADRLINLLEQEGASGYVHYIHGEMSLRQARVLRQQLDELGKWLQAERAARTARDAVAAFCLPAMNREARLLEIAYLAHLDSGSPAARQRQVVESESRTLLRDALYRFHQLSKHDPLALEAAAPSGECFARLKELGVPVPLREAIKRLRVAVTRDPDNVEAHRWLAALYLDMKAPHEAISELHEVARLAPTDGRPYRTIGSVYKLYRQLEPAKEAYEESLKRQLVPHVVAEVIVELAEVLVDLGHPSDALDELAKCPDAFAQEPLVLALKGECEWQLGHIPESNALVDRALKADWLLLPAIRLRASIYLAQEQPAQALPFLLRYIRIDRISNQPRKLLAETYRMLGEPQKEKEQMKQRDRLYEFNQQLMKLNTDLIRNPQDDELRYKIGALWLGIDQFADARLWFKSALEVNPGSVPARQALQRLDPEMAAQMPRN